MKEEKATLKAYYVTDFEKKVYRAILAIPVGEVRSYQWVAKKIGSPSAARAVGTALKNNPFAPIVPCHRVVKADGRLGGYSGGIRKKLQLLEMEKEIKKNIVA